MVLALSSCTPVCLPLGLVGRGWHIEAGVPKLHGLHYLPKVRHHEKMLVVPSAARPWCLLSPAQGRPGGSHRAQISTPTISPQYQGYLVCRGLAPHVEELGRCCWPLSLHGILLRTPEHNATQGDCMAHTISPQTQHPITPGKPTGLKYAHPNISPTKMHHTHQDTALVLRNWRDVVTPT